MPAVPDATATSTSAFAASALSSPSDAPPQSTQWTAPPWLSSPPGTPIHSRFSSASAPATPPRPAKLEALSPSPTRSTGTLPWPEPAEHTVAVVSSPPGDPPQSPRWKNHVSSMGLDARLAVEPTHITLPPCAPVQPASSVDGDSPLFRAVVASLVKRATALRSALRSIIKTSEMSIAALQQFMSTQTSIDKSLQALSLSSATAKSDVLGGLFELVLSDSRTTFRLEREAEVRRLQVLVERLKGSCERLKGLEAKHRSWEARAKKYYEDLGKYLGRTDIDDAKAQEMDSRQASRRAAFEAERLEFFSFIEGLVDSEERSVALWLREWCQGPTFPAPAANSKAGSPSNIPLPSDVLLPTQSGLPHVATLLAFPSGEGEPDSELCAPEVSDGGPPLSEDASPPSSSPSHVVACAAAPLKPARRRRRASIGLSLDATEGARGRIKGLIKTFSSTPSTVADKASPVQPNVALGGSNPTLPLDPQIKTPPSPQVPRVQPSSERKREGFLWAASHASLSGESGQWHKFWTVLSGGQLIEFSSWKSNLTVRGAPISLRFATTRLCRSGEVDRRFCFLVITPTARRTYQAASQEDASEWVATLQKSIESLLNGTSSVRHFDASRLSLSYPSAPYVLTDFGGSSTSLVTPVPDSPASPLPVPPSGGLNPISTRLPQWIGQPLLSRRPSLGGKRSRKGPPLSAVPKVANGEDRRDVETLAPAIVLRQPSSEVQRVFRHMPNEAAASVDALCVGGMSEDALDMGVWRATSSSQRAPSVGSFEGTAGDAGDAASDLGSVSDYDRYIVSEVNRMSHDLSADAKALAAAKVHNAQRVEDLVALPGNSTCADCGAADPRWTSWSLGVFICIRCAGHHRSLGTHISKVRSIDLDEWSDDQIATMTTWGNVKANAYWECHRPPDVTPTEGTMGTFIKTKYQVKEWTPRPPSPPLMSPISEDSSDMGHLKGQSPK